jgi:hypothetical protein
MVKIKFIDMPLGTRFKYAETDKAIWIKVGNEDNGVVAEYDPKFMTTDWAGQSICSFAETRKQMETKTVLAIG